MHVLHLVVEVCTMHFAVCARLQSKNIENEFWFAESAWKMCAETNGVCEWVELGGEVLRKERGMGMKGYHAHTLIM